MVQASFCAGPRWWLGSSAYRGEVGPDLPKGSSKKELLIITSTSLDLKEVLMVVTKHQHTRFVVWRLIHQNHYEESLNIKTILSREIPHCNITKQSFLSIVCLASRRIDSKQILNTHINAYPPILKCLLEEQICHFFEQVFLMVLSQLQLKTLFIIIHCQIYSMTKMWKLALVIVCTLCLLCPCSASYSAPAFSSSSAGAAYAYGAIDTFFQQKLNAANKITVIEYYESPVQDFAWLAHHQIIFQVDHEYWLLASLGYNGLEVGASQSKKTLVNRRKSNMLIDRKEVDVSAELMRLILKRYEGKNFHLLEWNCQAFANSVWSFIMAFDRYQ